MSILIAMQDMRRSFATIARRAEQGEEFVVIRNSRPSFRIMPYHAPCAATPPALSLKDITTRIDSTHAAANVAARAVDQLIHHVRKRHP